jgi:hypothetical protein
VVHHLAGRQHRVGDAVLHRIGTGEGVAEQQLLGRARLAHQLRQQQAGGEFRHQAQADEGHGQPGLVTDVGEVAVQQHRRADADGRAGDGGDHRLVALDQRAHELEHRRVLAVAAAAGRARHEVLDVVAGREDARLPGDQHRPHRAVGLGGVERVGHRLVHGDGQRVLLLRPRDLDGGDAVERGGLDGHLRPAR